MTDLSTRIRLYLSKCPPAVSGQCGHNQTFKVACALWNGFALSEYEALPFLSEFNQTCQPPWSEKELAHKLKSAATAGHSKPRGHLAGENATFKPDDYDYQSKPRPEPPSKKPAYNTEKPAELPDPMVDAARRFIMAAFLPAEAISISPAVMNAEQRCIPKGGGTTHSREEWIKKLDSVNGDPNKLFDTAGGLCGAFVRINPMMMGGAKDADVTACRHALIEFDHCSIEEQWNLITQSKIPCTAVLHSGNKSLHAWVRVDAKDRTEYASRVKVLYDHFAEYGIDHKNKNPSRFSRLPGMMRGKKKQDLLALNIGANSFDQWLIDKESDGIGQRISLKELLAFKPDSDPNCMLGKRWLCRGGSCLWVGQSGIGKSSLAMQAAISWAMEKALFGICPAGPLKSLFIQAENDEGDLAEMMQGVLEGMFGMNNPDGVDIAKIIEERIIIIRDQTHTGKEFTVAIQRLIEKHRPDIVWIDPLLSFIGDDISSQKVCSEFLRNWLNPISQASGVIWMLMHHTNKPEKDPKSRAGWTSSDYSYIGTGSAELVNWARAAVFLKQVEPELFKLMLTKRGKRAGAKDLKGFFTTDIYLEYSKRGICWVQSDYEPEVEEKVGRKSKGFNTEAFLKAFKGHYYNPTGVVMKASEFSGLGKSTIWEKVWPQLKNRLSYDQKSDVYTI